MKIGAHFCQDKSEFIVWAPNQHQVSLVLPQEKQVMNLEKSENGYWRMHADSLKPYSRYMFRLADGIDRPDPASQFQPDGVFGSSAIVDHTSFKWKDSAWHGINLEDMIIYELHVGTFSPEGNFAGARKRAAELSETGINAVELMPVSQFSGSRNWGYDAVFPFAVQNTYGGPEELKKLVQEFHANGVAVILDVVYNHLGPEGNVLNNFGPYLLLNRMTPWGASMNFDGPFCSEVRNFFFENADYWLNNYHIDGLRLDAVFAIIDHSSNHFLKELSEKVEALSKAISKKLLLIAENDHVDPNMIKSRKAGGYGLDAIWHDNLHHSLHAILTGERNWYYSSFGSLSKVVNALNEGCEDNPTQTTQLSAICSSALFPLNKLVVFTQNHDQIGNRPNGDRLITIAGVEAAKLAAGLTLLSPFTPLLFMGEEYGEPAPFLFFTDYKDKTIGKKVQVGRKRELAKNGWKIQPTNSPQDRVIFASSRINWDQRNQERGKRILDYYRKLIKLRKDLQVGPQEAPKFLTSKHKSLLVVQRKFAVSEFVTVANFSHSIQDWQFPFEAEVYYKVLDSSDAIWAGPGSTLPQKVTARDRLSICPLSMGVYLRSKGEKM